MLLSCLFGATASCGTSKPQGGPANDAGPDAPSDGGNFWRDGFGAQPPAVLVRDGQAVSTIVIPANASAAVQAAATELAYYLQQISDAAVPVTVEPPASGTIIYLGPSSQARAALPAALQDADEAVFVQVKEGQLVVFGGSDAATRYAVYALLEEGLGCRFLAADQEHVPRQRTIEVPALELAREPAFDWRFFHGRRGASLAWGLKQGLNGLYTATAVATAGDIYYFPDQAPSCHAYAALVPAKEHFTSHPDWFALVDGQRKASGQLCLTAAGLAEEVARQIVALFDADPQLQLVSISPNDGYYGWCECAACQALDQQLGGGRQTIELEPGETWRYVGEQVFWFANQVGALVAQQHPDRALLELAYLNYVLPPDKSELAANVIPWLAHYAPADYSRAIADPASPSNALFAELLGRWASSSPDLLFYSYVSKSMWWQLPRPIWRNFAADIKLLHGLGLHRYYSQSELTDWALDGPLYYVIAKLLWDPSRDPEAIAADWIAHMFGPAATTMTAFYDAVERAVRQSGQRYTDNPVVQVPGLYVRAELDAALEHLQASSALATSEPYQGRVAKVHQLFLYGYHLTRALELAAPQANCQLPQGAEAVAAGELALAQLSAPPKEALDFVKTLPLRQFLGVCTAGGWGEAESKGGRQCWNSDDSGSASDGLGGWATLIYYVPDPTSPARLELEVWGTSNLNSILVNTSGDGKATSAGGIWTAVSPNQALSGQPRWETLVFQLPAAAFTPGKTQQQIGLGSGDSQIWLAAGKLVQGD